MTDTIRWRTMFGRLGLFVLAFAATTSVAVLPLATVLAEWSESYPSQARVFADVASAIAVLSATWVMTKFVDKRRFSTLGFAPRNIIRDLSLGLAIGVAWLGVSVAILMVAGWASLQPQSAFSTAALLIAAVSVAFNVLTQQLLVCGYILQTIRAKTGWLAAVLVSAALFSVLHAGAFGGSWIPPVNVFVAGLVFCLAYVATGNLWMPIAIHFAWNLLLGPVLGLTVSGTGVLGLGWNVFEVAGPELFTGGEFGIEGGLVVTMTTVALATVLLLTRARLGVRGGGRDRLAAEDDRANR